MGTLMRECRNDGNIGMQEYDLVSIRKFIPDSLWPGPKKLGTGKPGTQFFRVGTQVEFLNTRMSGYLKYQVPGYEHPYHWCNTPYFFSIYLNN